MQSMKNYYDSDKVRDINEITNEFLSRWVTDSQVKTALLFKPSLDMIRILEEISDDMDHVETHGNFDAEEKRFAITLIRNAFWRMVLLSQRPTHLITI
jgi:hypothetical protein